MTDVYSPLVQDQKYLNEVKFAARDFASIADDLLRRLKIEYGDIYNDYASTDTGIMLRDLVAWAYAGISWYLDRTASDCYLETARTRAAVERLVEQIEYKMGRAAASGATCTLTFPNGTPDAFAMWERWRYTAAGGIPFEAIAQVTQSTALAEGATLQVAVRQGETKLVTYTADGTKNQSYRLTNITSDRFLAINSIEVWVDGSLWTEKDFIEYEKTNHYEVSYLADPPIVRFGDGIAGNIPPVGAEVKIRYIITDGNVGNVKSNAITTSVDSLVIGAETVNFTVTNPTRASGGRDPETIDRAKRWAPASFAARNSAITTADYEVLANTFVDPTYGAIAKAYAVNPRSSSGDAILQTKINNIVNVLEEFVVHSGSYTDNINAYALLLDGVISVIESYLDVISDARINADSNIDSCLDQVESARLTMVTAGSHAASAANSSALARASAETLRGYVAGGALTKDEIVSQLTDIISVLEYTNSESVNARTSSMEADSAITNSVVPKLQAISVDVQTGGTVDVALSSIDTSMTSFNTYVDNIQTNANSFEGSAGNVQTEVVSGLNDIDTHITGILSDDCRANYVQLPILATDLSGNYTAPSLGLIRAAQTYFDEVKEVTQVVEVMDGSEVLVLADISVILSVSEAYVFEEVRAQVESVIIGLLKGRDYNSSLYLSDLYGVVKLCKGVNYVNITIAGTGSTNGNLLTEEYQVIVLGSLAITEATA